MTKKQKKTLYRILLAAALMILLECLPITGWVKFALYMVPYLIIGYDILRKAVLGIVHGEVFDENFLMAVATVGAIILGEYTEGVAVMLFYQIGELFQAVAVGKSRKNITALMDIRPDYANIEDEDGNLEQVDPDDVEVGTIIVVRPGEKIPIDGCLVEGNSTLNTSALTGESIPREVSVGDEVISGCVNINGLLKIRTTKEFGESTVSKILDLVENSSMKKSRSENFISKFARYYTPAVCYGALALAVLPPLLGMVTGQDANWSMWINRALTFLVISCPCALVISIPLSFFGGIGGAASSGILVKGSNYLEALSQTKYVVMDKTGTLTKGVFAVSKVNPTDGFTKDALVEYAAYAESYSNHPISKSLREAYGKELDASRVTATEEVSGCGVKACVDGREILVGNEKILESIELPHSQEMEMGTVVHVAVDGAYAGYIIIQDMMKEESKEAIAKLKADGVKKAIMLTGDRKAVAELVAKELGMDDVRSELLPVDKVEQVESILAQKNKNEKVVFVGDGINDAPVLSRADIGIAMGALGSDAAIEAADIVLMDDDPRKIALAIRISRKCICIVYENIVFALGVKFAFLALGAVGLVGMGGAIFADVGVMVLAVMNAIRCLKVKA